jgi:hypothetical protein
MINLYWLITIKHFCFITRLDIDVNKYGKAVNGQQTKTRFILFHSEIHIGILIMTIIN